MDSINHNESDQQIDNLNNSNNEESNDSNTNINENSKKLKIKNEKRGIIYLGYVPLGINCRNLRQMLSQFGEIDRIYLEKDKSLSKGRTKKKSYNISYTEGWVEFKKKKIAKLVATTLNGTQIGGKRKNKFYDSIWSIKYLHKFKWSHLAEQMAYEKALKDQRLRFEIGLAKKEANFYANMIEKSNNNKRRKLEDNDNDNGLKRNYKQRVTDEEIRKNKNKNNDIDFDLLNKIFN